MGKSRSQKCFAAKFRKVCRPFLWALLLLGGNLNAQSYRLLIHWQDNNFVAHQTMSNEKDSFSSVKEALASVQRLIPKLQEKGFLAASLDSIAVEAATCHVFVFVGRRYKWALVDFGNINPRALRETSIDGKNWKGRPVSPVQIASLSERLLRWADNNGYPFASVWLQPGSISEEEFSGQFKMELGIQQKIDSIAISGSVDISRDFLLHYLELEQGEVYNEQKLQRVSQRLRDLKFLKEKQPPQFEFRLSGNILHIYLEEKKANQINALIGLIPNSRESGKFLWTVDALLAFQNALALGESFSFSFQNLQYKSPHLRVEGLYPYIFNTAFAVDGQFDLLKRDTSFRRTELQLGVRYQVNANDYLRLFYQNRSNRLISVDTAFVRTRKKLPDNIDVASNGGGMEFVLHRTDIRSNPRKGAEFKLSASALKRQIGKNDAITELKDGTGFDFSRLYDSLLARKFQYQLQGMFNYYFRINNQLVLKTGYAGGWMGSDYLFRNELYQIGGFRLLRGFDEESIFASQYHMLSLELRLYFDEGSFVYVFSDNAYVETKVKGSLKSDIYNGFGVGTSLETNTGLFSISYALGRDSENPVQFRQSRVHLGYVALF